MILSQFLQRTVTGVSEIRSNFYEPQFVQIGDALSGLQITFSNTTFEVN